MMFFEDILGNGKCHRDWVQLNMLVGESQEWLLWSKILKKRGQCDIGRCYNETSICLQYLISRNYHFSGLFKDVFTNNFVDSLSCVPLVQAFFGRGDLAVCDSSFCLLVSGSFSKIHDAVITLLKKFAHWQMCQEDQVTCFFDCSAQLWGFASLNLQWKFDDLFKFDCSLNFLNVNRRSDLTKVFKRSLFSLVFEVEGIPELCSCSSCSLPFKIIWASEKLELGFQNVHVFNFSNVTLTDSLGSTKI